MWDKRLSEYGYVMVLFRTLDTRSIILVVMNVHVHWDLLCGEPLIKYIPYGTVLVHNTDLVTRCCNKKRHKVQGRNAYLVRATFRAIVEIIQLQVASSIHLYSYELVLQSAFLNLGTYARDIANRRVCCNEHLVRYVITGVTW